MSNLLAETKRLLRETERPLDEIARQAGVGRRWLYMLAADEIPNPGVLGVQKVHDYLIANSRARAAKTPARAPITASS